MSAWEQLTVYMVAVLQPSIIPSPIAISLGAIAGALSRYYLTLWFAQRCGTNFPYGTLVINLSGALFMGFFTTLILAKAIAAPELQQLITVGFLGSYTTFSTYALDTVTLLGTGNRRAALFYWAGSAVLGVLCLEVGSFLAHIWQ